MTGTANVAVLVSGRGRNLQALIEAAELGKLGPCRLSVISNRRSAPALQRARNAGLETHVIAHRDYASREAFDEALQTLIDRLRPDLIVLAGFMRVLGAGLVTRYAGRMINVHPSLLPKYPGLDTHQRALDAGDTEHGASVHFVTPSLDGGPVIIQGGVSVDPQDTADRLAERVMDTVETRILPQAAAWILRGQVALVGDVVWFGNTPLASPLALTDLTEDFR